MRARSGSCTRSRIRDRLDEVVAGYVADLLAAAPGAIAAAKALIPDVYRRGPAEATTVTCEALAERRASPEGQEGLRAFLEKRKPCVGDADDSDVLPHASC